MFIKHSSKLPNNPCLLCENHISLLGLSLAKQRWGAETIETSLIIAMALILKEKIKLHTLPYWNNTGLKNIMFP